MRDAALAQSLEVARRAGAADEQAVGHAGRQHVFLGTQAQRGERAQGRRLRLCTRLSLQEGGEQGNSEEESSAH